MNLPLPLNPRATFGRATKAMLGPTRVRARARAAVLKPRAPWKPSTPPGRGGRGQKRQYGDRPASPRPAMPPTSFVGNTREERRTWTKLHDDGQHPVPPGRHLPSTKLPPSGAQLGDVSAPGCEGLQRRGWSWRRSNHRRATGFLLALGTTELPFWTGARAVLPLARSFC